MVFLLFATGTGVAASQSPYAGEELNEIKALSPGEIDDLLQGRGMGFAKVAELNRYPGPSHVLDLAAQLELSDRQLDDTRQVFERMRAQAMQLGKQLIERERELEALFASGRITAAQLDSLLLAIGETTARLRAVHLSAHLEMKTILSRHQVVTYDRLRGYSGGGTGHEHSH